MPAEADQAPDLSGVFVSDGEIEGHPSLTILNPPPNILTTFSSSSGSISGLLDTQRSWIWLHSLRPTGANVLPSIHQAGWPRGGRLWSACADRRWMRSRGLLPIAIFLLVPSSATPFSSCLRGLGVATLGYVVLLLKVTPPLIGKWNMRLGDSFLVMLFTVFHFEHLNLVKWPLFLWPYYFAATLLFCLNFAAGRGRIWRGPSSSPTGSGRSLCKSRDRLSWTRVQTHAQLFGSASSPPPWADRKWHLISIKALGIHWIFFPS